MDGTLTTADAPRPRWAWVVRGASGLAVASAVSAAAAADGPRAAVLLPPRVGAPAPATVIARGAVDDDPLATTPVARRPAAGGLRPLVPPSGAKAPPPPDWLTGVDPNVIPAGALAPAKGFPTRLTGEARPSGTTPVSAHSARLTPPPPLFTPGEPNPLAKGFGSLKGALTPDATPPAGPPAQPEASSPRDPLQGKAANGAPVLAGPPAWRWYGYGSVTPGANPLAPTGQYPRASANWYEVTRATPGAFPVPVVAPFRGGPGVEPPNYAGVPPARGPVPVEANTFVPPTRVAPVPLTSAPPPAGALRLGAAPPMAVLPPPVMPLPAPVAVAPPAFNPIPLPPPPSVVPVAPPRTPEPVAAAPLPLPLPTVEPTTAARPVAAPPVLPPLSVMPLVTPPPAAPVAIAAVPPPLPVVSPAAAPAPVVPAENDVRWQSNPTPAPGPAPGTWLPPADRRGQPGASLAPRQIIARGQIGDEVQAPADPVEQLVQAVCRGRATGVDVRHTGPRRVTVCFEVRTSTDATALVRDLSARPELAPYEIDFCVLVK